MNEISELARRFVDLEAHIAHQETTIQDLSDMTLQQWDEIRTLERKLARLDARVEELQDGDDPDTPSEPAPPHY
jgi:SlyX protein